MIVKINIEFTLGKYVLHVLHEPENIIVKFETNVCSKHKICIKFMWNVVSIGGVTVWT